eukprot:GDKH01010274.1.p2 GENE.GDKH01010274.1~~GDKH01010274.1.p2  ORF type:complete len:102 (-),score=4.54 GDKH01010274.1:223-528(-)
MRLLRTICQQRRPLAPAGTGRPSDILPPIAPPIGEQQKSQAPAAPFSNNDDRSCPQARIDKQVTYRHGVTHRPPERGTRKTRAPPSGETTKPHALVQRTKP